MNMDQTIQRHFAAFRRMDLPAVLGGYAPGLTAVVQAGAAGRTLGRQGLGRLLALLFRQAAARSLQVLCQDGRGDWGVLALSAPDETLFINYVCRVQGGAVTHLTLYVCDPSGQTRLPVRNIAAKGNQARRVFYKHALAMMSASADVIVKDYDENALVVTNLAGSACEGKAQVHAFCDHLMHSYGKILKSLRLHGLSAIHWKTTPAGGHLALFALDARCLGMVMTETYWVEDGKIRFESSICRGGMQETIQNL